jgi:hypothetical protein
VLDAIGGTALSDTGSVICVIVQQFARKPAQTPRVALDADRYPEQNFFYA